MFREIEYFLIFIKKKKNQLIKKHYANMIKFYYNNTKTSDLRTRINVQQIIHEFLGVQFFLIRYICKFVLLKIYYVRLCANGHFRAFLRVDYNLSDNAGRNISIVGVKLNK